MAARAAGHEAVLLVCDCPGAFALQRAARLGVPSVLVSYTGEGGDRAARRTAAEAKITAVLEAAGADLVALAGFMRLLSPAFVSRWQGGLVNIHPALLPAYPGTEAIRRAWDAGEPLLGVTVHYVDEGMDTGPVLARVEVDRQASLEETEQVIHEAEHRLYAQVIVGLLDGVGVGEGRPVNTDGSK